MIFTLLIISLPVVLLLGAAYGDKKATGYWPWQKEFDVEAMRAKSRKKS
tara:strand:+ start:458 stop:604 length:147 start_codon:yes stop_codon:yes gene_type:complete